MPFCRGLNNCAQINLTIDLIQATPSGPGRTKPPTHAMDLTYSYGTDNVNWRDLEALFKAGGLGRREGDRIWSACL